MQIYYIDNIDFGKKNCPHQMLPRVMDFPYRTVQDLVGDDKTITGAAGGTLFGQNKVRQE